MTDKYEHEIIDSYGTKHPFSLTVAKNGTSGLLVWPPEASALELVRRVTGSRITALIVWSTMKIRCWITASASAGGTDLEILFAMTPYRYRIEDGGAFVTFLSGLTLPNAATEDTHVGEQPAPPGGSVDSDEIGDVPNADNCGNLVYVEDRSDNQEYAYYYLVNESDEDAGVTIRNSWMYQGTLRTETKRHDLFPGQAKEVFSFPRAQNPKCVITHCRLG